MRTKCIDVYKLSELSDKAKKKAMQRHCDINVDHDWWESTYEDADRAGITITGFDIGRGQECTGNFKGPALESATLIVSDHGPHCETHKTAASYIQNRAALIASFVKDESGDISYDDTHTLEDLDKKFLRSILQDYLKSLREEYEYRTDDKQIEEVIEAQEMEFTIGGEDA